MQKLSKLNSNNSNFEQFKCIFNGTQGLDVWLHGVYILVWWNCQITCWHCVIYFAVDWLKDAYLYFWHLIEVCGVCGIVQVRIIFYHRMEFHRLLWHYECATHMHMHEFQSISEINSSLEFNLIYNGHLWHLTIINWAKRW